MIKRLDRSKHRSNTLVVPIKIIRTSASKLFKLIFLFWYWTDTYKVVPWGMLQFLRKCIFFTFGSLLLRLLSSWVYAVSFVIYENGFSGFARIRFQLTLAVVRVTVGAADGRVHRRTKWRASSWRKNSIKLLITTFEWKNITFSCWQLHTFEWKKIAFNC